MTISLVTASISAGQSLSAAVQITGAIVGIVMPAGWTAAPVSFMASFDGGVTLVKLMSDGNEVSMPLVAGAFNQIEADDIGADFWVAVRSGTSGSPVPQASTVSITLVVAT